MLYPNDSLTERPADLAVARLLETGMGTLRRDEEAVPGYELLGRIGEGGMAIVHLAEQAPPLRREVAVKVIKPGMDSAEVLARFEAERQVLALMDHPGIAQVYGAGYASSGRPYIAMELVDGPTLTEWSRRQGLGLRERLRLFVDVCGAVQHAHLKGVLHRDLKPSNLLVKLVGGRAIPKVIDFGVAKALVGADGWARADATQWTRPGYALGTPAYMSPEQASGLRHLDLRSDLYSLGVVLFELLVGEPPFRAGADGTDGLLAQIRDREAPSPSRALRERRPGDPMARELQGDLDCIVLKALEKEPARRYASAAELAADVMRFLEHEPVAARAPSRAYRVGRFVRRHWLPVSALAVAWASLVGGFGVSLWQTRVARQERNAAQVERNLAQQAQERAERVTGVIMDFVDAPDPTEDGREVRVLDVIRRTLAKAERELVEDPESLTRIRYALANTFHNLGEHAEAERLYRLSFSYFEKARGGDAPRTGECASLLGKLLFEAGQTEEGLRWLQDAVRRLRRSGDSGRIDLVWALVQYSGSLFGMGRMSEAEPLMREALPMTEGLTGENVQARGALMHNLAQARGDLGDRVEQRQLLGQAIEVLEKIPEANLDLATAYNNLGNCLREEGRLGEAEAAIQRSLEIRLDAFERKHVHVVHSLAALAGVVSMRSDHERAEWLARDALELHSTLVPAGGRERYGPLISLAGTLLRAGRATEAIPWLRELVALCHESYEAGATRTIQAEAMLGVALAEAGEGEAGLKMLRRAMAELGRTHAPGHPVMMQMSEWSERLAGGRAGL